MLRLSICFLFISLSAAALTGHDDLVKAFGTGDGQAITRQCGNRTQITMDGKDGLYTKEETAQMLKTFFAKHKPDKCDVLANKTSPKGAGVLVLKYASANNLYKITVYIQAATNDGALQSIRIEPLNKL